MVQNRITLIFGKTGQGKTTKAKEIIEDEKRIVVLDPLYEYSDFTQVYTLEDFYEYVKNKNEFKVSCRFDNDDAVEYLFRLIYVLKNICLVVEEAEIYISPQSRSTNFLYLVRYGRHTGIKIVGVARRTAELSIDLRAQTDRFISFKQTELRDIKIMSEIGLENLENLSEHECLEIFN